jgi:hypothetical protein
MSEPYIVSNQVRCNTCGGEPFSTHRHHFVNCGCNAIAVDGGQDYLRRVGNGGWEELSITIDTEPLAGLIGAIDASMSSGRNPLGVTLAALRAIRDFDLVPVKARNGGITHWITDAKNKSELETLRQKVEELEKEVQEYVDYVGTHGLI